MTNGDSKQNYVRDAQTLSKGIYQLERMQTKCQYNRTIYDVLGQVHHLRTIKLVNGGEVAEALVEAQKALTYNPFLEEAVKTRQQLVEIMTNLQAKMNAIMEDLRSRSNAKLNAEGQRLLQEAQCGFKLINEYVDSNDAKRIQHDGDIARACDLWETIGLSKPQEQWNERAMELMHALRKVFSEPPQSQADIDRVWQETVSGNEELMHLDATRICRFLEQRLFQSTENLSPPSNPSQEKPTANIPSLALTTTPKPKGKEFPFKYWLFGECDNLVKVQAVIAMLLLVISASMFLYEHQTLSIRNLAYQKIIDAVQHQNYQNETLQEFERFFSHVSLKQDARTGQVKQLYDEVFVHWFAQQEENVTDDTESEHIAYYLQISNNFQKQGEQP